MHLLVEDQARDPISFSEEVHEKVFECTLLDRVLEEVITEIECRLLSKRWLLWDGSEFREVHPGVPFGKQHAKDAGTVLHLTVEEGQQEGL